MFRGFHYRLSHSLLISTCVACFAFLQTAKAQDAREIIKKWEEKFYGQSAELELRMTIVRPEWTRKVAVKSWTLGHDYALLLIREPLRDAGNAYLKRNSEIWNWTPSIERTVKLPPGVMSQSWMGSDFTHDDAVRKSNTLEDYTHKLAGNEIIDGQECWIVELSPKEDAPVIWGKIRCWISKTDNLQLKTEFLDEDMELVSTLRFSNIGTLGGRKLPTRLEMTPAGKKGHSTVIEYLSANWSRTLDESFFSMQNMKQVK